MYDTNCMIEIYRLSQLMIIEVIILYKRFKSPNFTAEIFSLFFGLGFASKYNNQRFIFEKYIV